MSLSRFAGRIAGLAATVFELRQRFVARNVDFV
jgi:hypothetical protein